MRAQTIARIWYGVVWAIAIGWFIWATPVAMASGDRNNTDVDVDVDVGGTDVHVGGTDVSIGDTNLTGGDTNVSTGGNKTFAFAYGMGDVDINEGQNCYGSEQWGTVIVGRQTMELNAWCAALFYELNGRHERAAAMRCTIKDVRETHPYYGDEMACIEGETLRPDEPTVVGEVPAEVPVDEFIEQQIQIAVDEEVADQHEQVEYRIAQQSNLIESLQQENDQLRHQIRGYVDETADLRAYVQDQMDRKERAREILQDDEDENE